MGVCVRRGDAGREAAAEGAASVALAIVAVTVRSAKASAERHHDRLIALSAGTNPEVEDLPGSRAGTPSLCSNSSARAPTRGNFHRRRPRNWASGSHRLSITLGRSRQRSRRAHTTSAALDLTVAAGSLIRGAKAKRSPKGPFGVGRQDHENQREARRTRRSVAMSHRAAGLPEGFTSCAERCGER